MHFVRMTTLLLAAAALSGCAYFSPSSDLRSAGARGEARTPRIEDDMFLSAALARTQSEFDLARMAGTKAVVPPLAAYARRVAEERAALKMRLAALASRNGVPGDSDHAPDAQRFAALTGDVFERAYLAAQLEDQQNNIDFFKFEAATTRDPDLRELAAGEVPQLQQDLADAQTIVTQLPVAPPSTPDEPRP